MSAPIRVAITGAAGNIAYSLIWMVASGACFGDRKVILQLLEITPALEKLKGVVMEIADSSFPLVEAIVATDDPKVAFAGVEAVFLVGSRPRGPGMSRADLVAANGPIFVGQGNAIAEVAHNDVRVLVVGNPCNTNALIASKNAGKLKPSQFHAMTRLDQNRAQGALAEKLGVPVSAVSPVAIWGNHADTMYPDVSRTTVGGKPAGAQVDGAWLKGEFLSTVAKRGAAIIAARGASSAASAAQAAVDHMHDWFAGTNGKIVSMALPSEGWYGVPAGLVFSFPCTVDNKGQVSVVTDWPVDDFAKAKIAENVKALEEERVAVAGLLG